jgi:hypothetical protein
MAMHTPANLDELMAHVPECRSVANMLVELVVRIDIQLSKIDVALMKLQPQKSGRLRIQWWKSRGNIIPTVAKWIYVKPGLWRAERVNIESLVLVVKTSHEWRPDSPVVKDLMRLTKKLLLLRIRALERIENFKKTAFLNSYNQNALESTNADLDDLLLALENRTDVPDPESVSASPVLLEMEPEDDD